MDHGSQRSSELMPAGRHGSTVRPDNGRLLANRLDCICQVFPVHPLDRELAWRLSLPSPGLTDACLEVSPLSARPTDFGRNSLVLYSTSTTARIHGWMQHWN